MSPKSPGRSYALRAPRSWLARAGLITILAAFTALALFFLAIFFVVGTVLAVVLAVGWWWRSHKARRAASDGAIEGEYAVVQRANILPAERRPADRASTSLHDGKL